MRLSQPSEPARAAEDQAANLPLEAPVDAAEAWERFSAAWPFEPVPYRRAAAEAAFAKLTREEREEAIRCAPTFAKAWRARRRSGLPDARSWIRAKGWEALKRTPANRPVEADRPPSGSWWKPKADRLPDGSWWLHPDSPQLRAWHGHERRTLGRASLGFCRPSAWPPGYEPSSNLPTCEVHPRAGPS